MPMHDWTRVSAGAFHGFHTQWISSLSRLLNTSLLPDPFYAEPEQVAGDTVPDVLTLERVADWENDQQAASMRKGGALAVAEVKPAATIHDQVSEAASYAARRNRLAIRHASGDQVIAFIEIVSQGNKQQRIAFDQFLDKACSVLREGIHLMILDCYPPTAMAPEGMHAAIWHYCSGESKYRFDASQPLVFASYCAAAPLNAYVEPLAVNQRLPVLPLFLDRDWYVNVPLEETYQQAFEAIPRRWQQLLSIAR